MSETSELALRAANRLRAAIDDLNAAYEVMWEAGAHDIAEQIANTAASARGDLTDVERWGEGA